MKKQALLLLLFLFTPFSIYSINENKFSQEQIKALEEIKNLSEKKREVLSKNIKIIFESKSTFIEYSQKGARSDQFKKIFQKAKKSYEEIFNLFDMKIPNNEPPLPLFSPIHYIHWNWLYAISKELYEIKSQELETLGLNQDDYIDVSGLEVREVIKQLWDNAFFPRFTFLICDHEMLPSLDYETIDTLIKENRLDFDHCQGKILKINLRSNKASQFEIAFYKKYGIKVFPPGTTIDTFLYNRENGYKKAQKTIYKLIKNHDFTEFNKFVEKYNQHKELPAKIFETSLIIN